MPNVRPTKLMTVKEHQYQATSRLRGMRRVFQWMPYVSGQQASLIVTLEAIGNPYPDTLAYVLLSDIQDGMLKVVTSGQLNGEKSINIESPWEYISAPGDYRWELSLGGGIAKTGLADFSALARDRLVFGVGLAILTVIISTLAGLGARYL